MNISIVNRHKIEIGDLKIVLIFAIINFVLIIASSCSHNSLQGSIIEGQSQKKENLQNNYKYIIALFPFDNYSDDSDAVNVVMPLVRDWMIKNDFAVLDDKKLEDFLLKERIRATGYVSKSLAKKMWRELKVKSILVGSVNTFNSGKNPQVGLTARLISSADGSIIWADHYAASGKDFTGILDLGTITNLDKLAKKVVDKLFDSFDIQPPYKEKESTYRIAVMPFKNKSQIYGAGMITTYFFNIELFKNKRFVPVPYGDVRRLIVDFRVRSKGELDYKNIGSFAKSEIIDGILVGTVEQYDEQQPNMPPIAVISARLINVRTGKILWYDGYQYKGDDSVTIFDWGRIRLAENVAYKVVSKLVKDMSRVKWH